MKECENLSNKLPGIPEDQQERKEAMKTIMRLAIITAMTRALQYSDYLIEKSYEKAKATKK